MPQSLPRALSRHLQVRQLSHGNHSAPRCGAIFLTSRAWSHCSSSVGAAYVPRVLHLAHPLSRPQRSLPSLLLLSSRSQGSLRGLAVQSTPPLPDQGLHAGASSSSSSETSQPPRWRRSLVFCLKSLAIWLPATLFWAALVSGAPLFDLRTDEEIQEDESEARRLERFFDIEGIPEELYMAEWSAKEEAITHIVEKLLKSHRVMNALAHGVGEEDRIAEASQVSWSPARKSSPLSVEVQGQFVEVSYVLPPPPPLPGESPELAIAPEHQRLGEAWPRTWWPRLIVAHRSGALALVALALEHVGKGKDREERWTCTQLRVEVVAGPGGDPLVEPVCNLIGHVPHGVRYMRI